MIVVATYQRQLHNAFSGVWLGETPIVLVADVTQDSGEGFASELCVVWDDETLATIAAAVLDCDELIGCVEVVESRFWNSEAETCRLLKVNQQLGTVAA